MREETPTYTTRLSLKSRRILLVALNEIAIGTHSDTVVWGTVNKDGKIQYWYAPHLCKRTERTKEDFVEQFESPKMATQILEFIERGYI